VTGSRKERGGERERKRREEKGNKGTSSSILVVPLQKPVEIPLLFPFSPSPWLFLAVYVGAALCGIA